MKNNKSYGKCCICGKEKKLTFEHIPPNKALNNKEARFITGEEAIKLISSEDRLPWDTSGLKYVQEQKGAGKRTLCKECNNLTGTYYGDEYCRLANGIAYNIQKIEENIKEINGFHLVAKDIYPLRFIKQVLSMFCSTTQGLSDYNTEIRRVLLHKKDKIENPNFRISMFLVKNQIVSWTGYNALYMGEIDKIRAVSEIVAYPFGFIFDYDRSFVDDRLLDISCFLNYEYDETATFDITFPFVEKNMPFPGDFRTKEEVIRMIEENKKHKQII